MIILGNENIKANSDVQAVDFLLKENPSDSAIVINLRVFNRMLTHYAELFSLKGKAIIYKGNTHVYFHNGTDGDIRTKKADRSIESQVL